MSHHPPPRLLHAITSHTPSTIPDTYIYTILPCLGTSSLAVLTSADELLVLDRQTLRNQGGAVPGVPGGVTCLVGCEDGNVVGVGGRDGGVGVFDLRAGRRVGGFESDQKRPVTALAWRQGGWDIAAGTEHDGNRAVISIWDTRQSKIRWQAVESHNDDITDLQFHPTISDRLLSGSTDGLVSVFDVTIQDEDEALIQVVNHGSIHRAGFLAEDAIFALSHDEQFSIHPLHTADEEAVEPTPIVFGDLREKLGCDYVVDVMVSGQGPVMVTGSHSSEQKLDMIPIGANPSWSLQDNRKVQLVGGHEEEIVRTIYVDDETQSVYTGGEDGVVRIWKPSDTEAGEEEEVQPRSGLSKKSKEGRFKPY